jgi:hypothetical protein
MNPLPVNSRRYAAGLDADGPIAVEFDLRRRVYVVPASAADL